MEHPENGETMLHSLTHLESKRVNPISKSISLVSFIKNKFHDS